MITKLDESRKLAEAEWEEAERIRREAEKLHQELKEKLEQLERQKQQILKEAEAKAEKAVEKAREEAEWIIAELREMKERGLQVKEHELIDAKKMLDEAVPQLTARQKRAKQLAKKAQVNVKPGDEVKVLSLGQKGFVVEEIGEDEVQVQIGVMKMTVKKADLQPIDRPSPLETKPLVTVRGSDYHVKPELDLRGKRYEEAMQLVEKYLDDAVLAGYQRVSIIHGKGSGALRRGVKQLLKNHPHVKSERDGGITEGGLGNTIVELK